MHGADAGLLVATSLTAGPGARCLLRALHTLSVDMTHAYCPNSVHATLLIAHTVGGLTTLSHGAAALRAALRARPPVSGHLPNRVQASNPDHGFTAASKGPFTAPFAWLCWQSCLNQILIAARIPPTLSLENTLRTLCPGCPAPRSLSHRRGSACLLTLPAYNLAGSLPTTASVPKSGHQDAQLEKEAGLSVPTFKSRA